MRATSFQYTQNMSRETVELNGKNVGLEDLQAIAQRKKVPVVPNAAFEQVKYACTILDERIAKGVKVNLRIKRNAIPIYIFFPKAR